MITVKEINQAFANKGVHLTLPLNSNWLVKDMKILEKEERHGDIELLLSISFIDDTGKEKSDIFLCHGQKKRERKDRAAKIEPPLKSSQLPLREKVTFSSDPEAKEYLREAIIHLLQDKGYHLEEQDSADLYLVKGERGFFINFSYCNEQGLERVRELVKLREKNGSIHEYGLVTLAFQESLGIPLRIQEKWVSKNIEYLSVNRIGVYGVDNRDPNCIYPFTIYPRDRELMRYFMRISPRWSLAKARYVQSRKLKSI